VRARFNQFSGDTMQMAGACPVWTILLSGELGRTIVGPAPESDLNYQVAERTTLNRYSSIILIQAFEPRAGAGLSLWGWQCLISKSRGCGTGVGGSPGDRSGNPAGRPRGCRDHVDRVQPSHRRATRNVNQKSPCYLPQDRQSPPCSPSVALGG
jgi:hypothetical protein